MGSAGCPHPLLELCGLTKVFGGLTAVNEFDLTVRTGTIHAIIGPNGSGKTTLINMISGLLDPTSGTILFKEHDLRGTRPDQRAVMGISRTFRTPGSSARCRFWKTRWWPVIAARRRV